jgi:hypothetical protein
MMGMAGSVGYKPRSVPPVFVCCHRDARPGEQVDPNQQTRTSKGTFLSAWSDDNGILA